MVINNLWSYCRTSMHLEQQSAGWHIWSSYSQIACEQPQPGSWPWRHGIAMALIYQRWNKTAIRWKEMWVNDTWIQDIIISFLKIRKFVVQYCLNTARNFKFRIYIHIQLTAIYCHLLVISGTLCIQRALHCDVLPPNNADLKVWDRRIAYYDTQRHWKITLVIKRDYYRLLVLLLVSRPDLIWTYFNILLPLKWALEGVVLPLIIDETVQTHSSSLWETN